MALGSGGRRAGTSGSRKSGPGGYINTSSYDAGAAMQQRMAQEQWDWQKDIYSQNQAMMAEAGEGMTGLVDQYNMSFQEAKDANESRYNDMLGIADAGQDVRSGEVNRAFAGRESDMLNRLKGIGAANTSIASTQKMGIERERQNALDKSKMSHDDRRLGIMERRTDDYPENDIILQLAQMMGQSGGPGGVGGMVNALSGMRV